MRLGGKSGDGKGQQLMGVVFRDRRIFVIGALFVHGLMTLAALSPGATMSIPMIYTVYISVPSIFLAPACGASMSCGSPFLIAVIVNGVLNAWLVAGWWHKTVLAKPRRGGKAMGNDVL